MNSAGASSPRPALASPLLRSMLRVVLTVVAVLALLILATALGCVSLERRLLYYPTHKTGGSGLAAWKDRHGNTIGFARPVAAPRNVWLLLHGNAGQAADRTYALPSFASDDAVYILEYPGYGERTGTPSQESFNTAAREAFQVLAETYPRIPLCVVGESIGTGPACALAEATPPPAKIVLITPFAQLAAVARDHFPSLLVRVALKSDWNNAEALARYQGRIDIFAAEKDSIIPPQHARVLASAKPTANFQLIPGDHNDWAWQGHVRIRN